MKRIRFIGIIAVLLFSFTLVNCEKEETPPNNNNNPPVVPTGNLQIFVRQDAADGLYIGNANVYLYKSKADRDANIVYKEGITPTENTTIVGVIFEKLVFQKYYLKATYVNAGNEYEGLGETYCPVSVTTNYNLVCIKK